MATTESKVPQAVAQARNPELSAPSDTSSEAGSLAGRTVVDITATPDAPGAEKSAGKWAAVKSAVSEFFTVTAPNFFKVLYLQARVGLGLASAEERVELINRTSLYEKPEDAAKIAPIDTMVRKAIQVSRQVDAGAVQTVKSSFKKTAHTVAETLAGAVKAAETVEQKVQIILGAKAYLDQLVEKLDKEDKKFYLDRHGNYSEKVLNELLWNNPHWDTSKLTTDIPAIVPMLRDLGIDPSTFDFTGAFKLADRENTVEAHESLQANLQSLVSGGLLDAEDAQSILQARVVAEKRAASDLDDGIEQDPVAVLPSSERVQSSRCGTLGKVAGGATALTVLGGLAQIGGVPVTGTLGNWGTAGLTAGGAVSLATGGGIVAAGLLGAAGLTYWALNRKGSTEQQTPRTPVDDDLDAVSTTSSEEEDADAAAARVQEEQVAEAARLAEIAAKEAEDLRQLEGLIAQREENLGIIDKRQSQLLVDLNTKEVVAGRKAREAAKAVRVDVNTDGLIVEDEDSGTVSVDAEKLERLREAKERIDAALDDVDSRASGLKTFKQYLADLQAQEKKDLAMIDHRSRLDQNAQRDLAAKLVAQRKLAAKLDEVEIDTSDLEPRLEALRALEDKIRMDRLELQEREIFLADPTVIQTPPVVQRTMWQRIFG